MAVKAIKLESLGMGSSHQSFGHMGGFKMCSQGKEPLALEKEPEGWSQENGFELQLGVTSFEALE